MTKTCRKCKLVKTEIEFSIRAGKYTSDCLLCKRLYNRSNYNLRSSTSKSARIDQVAVRRRELRKMLWEYKSTKKCFMCEEDDTVVLEFDHIDSSDKEAEVSKLVKNGFSWERILAEISKCQVLCANCHRRKTAKQLGWYVG